MLNHTVDQVVCLNLTLYQSCLGLSNIQGGKEFIFLCSTEVNIHFNMQNKVAANAIESIKNDWDFRKEDVCQHTKKVALSHRSIGLSSYTSALALRGVAKQYVAHVIDLCLPGEGHYWWRKVPLQGSKEHRAKIQLVLQVIVVVGIVVGGRTQLEPARQVGGNRRRRDGAIACSLEWLSSRSSYRHDNSEISATVKVNQGFPQKKKVDYEGGGGGEERSRQISGGST